jgi:hypothetical protein
MDSVRATGHKVRVFKTGGGRQILKGDKNPQHAFFWRPNKASTPCRKILQHVKDPCGV